MDIFFYNAGVILEKNIQIQYKKLLFFFCCQNGHVSFLTRTVSQQEG